MHVPSASVARCKPHVAVSNRDKAKTVPVDATASSPAANAYQVGPRSDVSMTSTDNESSHPERPSRLYLSPWRSAGQSSSDYTPTRKSKRYCHCLVKSFSTSWIARGKILQTECHRRRFRRHPWKLGWRLLLSPQLSEASPVLNRSPHENQSGTRNVEGETPSQPRPTMSMPSLFPSTARHHTWELRLSRQL